MHETAFLIQMSANCSRLEQFLAPTSYPDFPLCQREIVIFECSLEIVAPASEDEALNSNTILTLLCGLSKNVLSSDAPAVPPQIKLQKDGSVASSAPSVGSGGSLEDAYDAGTTFTATMFTSSMFQQ